MASQKSHYSFQVQCKNCSGWLQRGYLRTTSFPLVTNKTSTLNTLNLLRNSNICHLRQLARIMQIIVLAWTGILSIPAFITGTRSEMAISSVPWVHLTFPAASIGSCVHRISWRGPGSCSDIWVPPQLTELWFSL